MDSDRYDLISNQRDYMAFAGSLLEVRDAARLSLWVFLVADAVTIMLLMALMARERAREIGTLRFRSAEVSGARITAFFLVCCPIGRMGISGWHRHYLALVHHWHDSVVVVTHNPLVSGQCDRILRMRGGSMVEQRGSKITA